MGSLGLRVVDGSFDLWRILVTIHLQKERMLPWTMSTLSDLKPGDVDPAA
ncbi:MAG: hypothetical protein HKN21_03785 [Candidatus Eisenbacteria bacterium]|uniref:Uncharacterized protein n=1 Tax=Eiseniibacteriota bacterium TaxID=2212470 RepID=A0A7Y2H1D4_UNCEI|nr:hypothetical protein [Candidatus Eisenbacteria bacterium]